MRITSDVALTGWAAITVRVAWTLLSEGTRVRAATLRDVRDHVLLHLDPDVPLTVAEDMATDLTRRFVARARSRTIEDPWPQDNAMTLSPRWRRAIECRLGQLTALVFRQHFSDGRSLEHLGRSLGIEASALDAARSTLRECLRQAGATDGLPFDQWPPARLDRLLRRIAAWAPGPCPPPLEVIESRHREHVHGCSRCDRTVRLVQSGVLAPADLVPPTSGARPACTASVLAVHFHPEAREFREQWLKETSLPHLSIGDDLLLLDASDLEAVRRLVLLAVEVSSPDRDRVRGALLEGPGRWSLHGLLGPLGEQGEIAVRSRAWGCMDGVGELPAPLPEAPSARRWWVGAATVAAIGLLLAASNLRPETVSSTFPLSSLFTPGRGGVWAEFDVGEPAVVTLVREIGGGLDVVQAGASPSDKATFATGDGRYRVHTVADALLVVSTPSALQNLDGMIAAAKGAKSPLDDLAARISATDARSDIALWYAQ